MKIQNILDEAKKGVRAMKHTIKPRNFVAKNAPATTGGAGAHKDKKKAAKQGDVKHKKKAMDLAEGAEFGAYYYEQLAQKVFDENPNLDASGRADEVMNAGWKFAVQDLGKKRAQWEFSYDEDFPSDFVSAYAWLQREGAANTTEGQRDDPEMKQTIRDAQRHYPGSDEKGAFNKFVQRSLKHSKEDDKKLKKQVNALSQKISKLKEDILQTKLDEAMLPKSVFAGSNKHKMGPAGQLKGTDPKGYPKGKLVGGSAMEAMQNPDTMSQTDYDRWNQDQMDQQKRNFKRDEMEHELGHEDRGMYWVMVAKNGKWEYTKAQPKQQGMNPAMRLISSLHAKYPGMHLGMQWPNGQIENYGKGK